ncbi:hypothetical protein B4N89_13570 [Embleya scabrispora]|uniref:Uncharacterized protein n=1 Tax=Embleya scabrispora TaxID=159449 RepID=A0A1T3NYC3_9ACTN|nr:hypothetical protein [Embleya scabrispora]OPC81828.1 hypothetical protein B4N89_13570 [Embleya scabrispora]
MTRLTIGPRKPTGAWPVYRQIPGRFGPVSVHDGWVTTWTRRIGSQVYAFYHSATASEGLHVSARPHDGTDGAQHDIHIPPTT